MKFTRVLRPAHRISTSVTFQRASHTEGTALPVDRLQKLLKIMPKETTLRHIRQRVLGNNPPPSEAYFQVVGDGSLGSPKVVMLITPGYRYLFNCGEGTQRIIQEHKLRLSRVENVFFTTKSWANIGGIPGLSLTVRDIGVPKLTMHGPDGLSMIYPMTKRFLQMQDMEIEQRPLSDNMHEDDSVTITYVPVVPQLDETRPSGETVPKRPRRNSGDSKNDIAVAYIGKIAPLPGRLDMVQCMKSGVPPGPLLAKLKDGLDIQLSNGKVVRSLDVCGPSCPGPVFVVVECPSLNHLDSLTKNEAFRNYQNSATRDHDRAELVIHFTPQDIMEDLRYRQWMNQFSASTKHLVVNNSNNNPCSIAIYRIQTMLNLLDDVMFPLLPAQLNGGTEAGTNATWDAENTNLTVPARPLQKYYLRPDQKKLVQHQCFQLNEDEYRSEAYGNAGLKELVELRSSQYPSRPFVEDFSEPDITFLGTGSAIPSKVRNTSGILIRTSQNCSILLDCGENTYGQLLRFFGHAKSAAEIRRLKAVVISHPHADHHLGLISLLQARKALFQKTGEPVEKLVVFVPEPVAPYLHAFSDDFEFIDDWFQDVSCSQWHRDQIDDSTKQQYLNYLEMEEIQLVPVLHCPHSFGISLTSKGGFKVCYSGDTMPCDALVEIGKSSDLLIHEATMEDSMEEDARKKMHSTTSQAIEIGRRMRARFTLLTHFSQRYAKIPLLKEELPTDVGIAFDNMRVRMSDLRVIPSMLPVLKLMFSEAYELMQDRSERREKRMLWDKEDQEIRDKMIEERLVQAL